MPDLRYRLRHPIQEARIAWMNRVPVKQLRPAHRRYLRAQIMQWIVRHIAAPWCEFQAETGDGFTSDYTNVDLIGEDEDGYLMGPDVSRSDYWTSWDIFKRGHLAAAIKTRRTRLAVMLERA